ncbi:hypothetical protein NI456_05595 [Brevundimonas diminuta]|uniref:hypothetical protein n=1 Tax=Brevundimonas diminuta TaxID=293 RepID=UPI0020970DB8|nr:hypothetical protein [Brevundimonas diminuta]MCO8018329.1 hypothetical protein [Brevundimonas diminuta]MCO8022147.1 hypothetical protein [Brevundimonas diminuta]
MMKTLLIAAVLAVASPSLTLAQNTAAPAPQAPVQTAPTVPPGPAATGMPVLPPATESADCGGLLRSPAFCVTAQLDQIGALADAYSEHLASLNWLAADGDDNRVIFVRRREGGGCDGLQMIAFYDESKPAEATAPGYLGFAVIPGDVCTSGPASPAAGTLPQ